MVGMNWKAVRLVDWHSTSLLMSWTVRCFWPTMFIFANEDFDMLDKVDLNLIVEPNGHKSTDTSLSCSKFEDSKHTEEPKTNSDSMANKAPKENLAANLVITNDQSASDAPKDNLDANSKATSSNSASDSASVALNQVLLSR